MPIPTNIRTEPIGSIPRPVALIDAVRAFAASTLSRAALDALYAEAVADTVRCFEATGSPVISDGEQRKHHDFASYPVHGLPNFAPDGFKLQFLGHYRQWPRLTSGPFRFATRADTFLAQAKLLAHVPLKQAVIAPSALSLLYPAEPIVGYPRETFLEDVLREHETEVRACLDAGACAVQIDFTEGRLAMKLDPTGQLLNSFITLNNMALDRFSESERSRLGIHTCPGGDRDSTHSLDVDYGELLPSLFELNARTFYIALAREPDRKRVLEMVRTHRRPEQHVFVGVIDVLDPRVESAEEVRDRVLEAADYISLEYLGTTDDCGFAPFSDDLSTSRDTAFAKIRARVLGTALASEALSRRTDRA